MNTRDPQPGTDAGALTRYLLGELSQEEQNRLEDQLFAEGRYGQLAAVEEDLIEAYARGELPAPERAKFESHFLASPARRAQVEFTRALLAALDAEFSQAALPAEAKRRRSWLPALNFSFSFARLAWATALLLVAAGAVWLGVESLRLRDKLRDERTRSRQQEQRHQQQLADEQARNERLTAELESARGQIARLQAPAPPPPSTLSFPLSPDAARSGGASQRLIVPPTVTSIRFLLRFDNTDSYRGLRATLETAEGRRVTQRPAKLTSAGQAVLTLSTNLFTTNDYVLTLQGIAASAAEDIADYQFTIVKQ